MVAWSIVKVGKMVRKRLNSGHLQYEVGQRPQDKDFISQPPLKLEQSHLILNFGSWNISRRRWATYQRGKGVRSQFAPSLCLAG